MEYGGARKRRAVAALIILRVSRLDKTTRWAA